jgi:hypothetical protein
MDRRQRKQQCPRDPRQPRGRDDPTVHRVFLSQSETCAGSIMSASTTTPMLAAGHGVAGDFDSNVSSLR